MDLYEWAAGTWYAEMSAFGRGLYSHLKVGDPEAQRIANVIYGMEVRARELLGTDDLATVPGHPPQDQVGAVLRGDATHIGGAALRPQAQTREH